MMCNFSSVTIYLFDGTRFLCDILAWYVVNLNEIRSPLHKYGTSC